MFRSAVRCSLLLQGRTAALPGRLRPGRRSCRPNADASYDLIARMKLTAGVLIQKIAGVGMMWDVRIIDKLNPGQTVGCRHLAVREPTETRCFYYPLRFLGPAWYSYRVTR